MNPVVLRDQWIFRIAATEVQGAVEAKLQLHTERLKFWLDEEVKREDIVRKEGIKFNPRTKPMGTGYNDPVAANFYAVTAANKHQFDHPEFDDEKVNDLAEAQERVQYHRTMVNQFVSWQKALTYASGTLELTYNDILFFDMARVPELVEA